MGMFSDLKKIDKESRIEAEKKASRSPIDKKFSADRPVKSEKPIAKEVNIAIKPSYQSIARVKEIRITLPLPTDLLSFLDQMERDIFVRRSAKFRSRQRLTKNSIARAWLALLRELNININDIENESDLLERFKKSINEFHIV